MKSLSAAELLGVAAMAETKWSGETDEAHPEIFNSIPPQPKVLKPGQLSEEKIKQFFDEGFIILDKFFEPEELNPVIDSINGMVEDLAQKLYKGGKVKNLYSESGFFDRLTNLENEFPGAMILLHKIGQLPQTFRNVWSNERLLNVAEQILGTSDIAGHPVWNLRTKTPRSEAGIVPWHQDVAYLDNDSYKVFQLTAWIPLLDSNANNGCMQMVRGGQKTGKVARHVGCWRDTWYVSMVESEVEEKLGCNLERDTITCPIPFGGVLLFSNAIPHRSLDNVSDKIRWSLDLRWQDAKKPVGFYGLKPGIQMRSSSESNFKIDWDSFDAVNRHEKQSESMNAKNEDFFDTTIPGPWMKKWELVHHNRHTKALLEHDGSSWHNLIVG